VLCAGQLRIRNRPNARTSKIFHSHRRVSGARPAHLTARVNTKDPTRVVHRRWRIRHHQCTHTSKTWRAHSMASGAKPADYTVRTIGFPLANTHTHTRDVAGRWQWRSIEATQPNKTQQINNHKNHKVLAVEGWRSKVWRTWFSALEQKQRHINH
jgi:hypothetical protein